MGRRPKPVEPGPEYNFSPYPAGTLFLYGGFLHEIIAVDMGSSSRCSFVRAIRKFQGHEEKVTMRLSEVMMSVIESQRISREDAKRDSDRTKVMPFISEVEKLQKKIAIYVPQEKAQVVVDLFDAVLDQLTEKKNETEE